MRCISVYIEKEQQRQVDKKIDLLANNSVKYAWLDGYLYCSKADLRDLM